jgi:hypothetical protein
MGRTGNAAPVVSNGLFSGAALKEDDEPKTTAQGKLGFFDYDSDEDKPKARMSTRQPLD